MGLRELDIEKDAVLSAIDAIEQAGVMGIGHHGNYSVRIAGTDTFLLIGGNFDSVRKDDFVLVDLEGQLVEGNMTPRDAEIVHLHTVVYQNRPEAGSAVHVHSTWGTTLAVASRPIACSYEAMARFNMTDGIPLAKYGPRGSDLSIQYIADALNSAPNIRAVLLEHHGILAFGENPAEAARSVLIVEAAAQLEVQAAAIGGAKPIPREMMEATVQRRNQFEEAGAQRA
ncbi:MAG: class II aldolase/adducin family protein [Dehalococcoidia bacterium]